MDKLSVFSAWPASLYVLNIVAYVTSVSREVISMFLLCISDLLVTDQLGSSHCPWVWNCGWLYLLQSLV